MTSVQALQEASVNGAGSTADTNPLLMVLLAMLLSANNQARDVNSALDDVKQMYALFEEKQAQLQQLTKQLDALSTALKNAIDQNQKQSIEYQIQSKNNEINNARMEMNGLQGQITAVWQGKVSGTIYEANTSMQEASQMLQGLNKVNSKINKK